MKNLQKKIALSGLIFLSVLLFSCSKEEVVGSNASDNESSSNYAVTPADQFIASPEFKAYEKVSKEAHKRFASNFSKLSDAEREQFGALLNEAKFTSDVDQINKIIDKMNSLTGLDFVRESNRIKRYAEPLNIKNSGISDRDLLVSLKKRQLTRRVSSPLVKSGIETEDYVDYLLCKAKCEAIFVARSLLCLPSIEIPLLFAICEGFAFYENYECLSECEEEFLSKLKE